MRCAPLNVTRVNPSGIVQILRREKYTSTSTETGMFKCRGRWNLHQDHRWMPSVSCSLFKLLPQPLHRRLRCEHGAIPSPKNLLFFNLLWIFVRSTIAQQQLEPQHSFMKTKIINTNRIEIGKMWKTVHASLSHSFLLFSNANGRCRPFLGRFFISRGICSHFNFVEPGVSAACSPIYNIHLNNPRIYTRSWASQVSHIHLWVYASTIVCL